MRSQSLFLIFPLILETATSVTEVKVGVLLMTSEAEPFDLRRVGAALDIAFELAETKYGIRFIPKYHNYTGFCPKETVIGHLSELHYVYNVKAVIGPACSATLVAAGRLAQYLNLPIVSGVGDLIIRDPSDKDMYTTFTRMSYNLGKLSNSMVEILKEYSWSHLAILYDQDYVFFNLAGSQLAIDLKGIESLPRPVDIPFSATKLKDPGSLLQEASQFARFFVIFCSADLLRTFLYRADQLGMTNGGYVFLAMELFPSDWLGHYKLFYRGDYMDTAVTKAYQSLLLLTVRQPDNVEYLHFAEEVKNRSKRDYGYEFGKDEVVNYFITAFYDGAIYLAESYNRTIQDGGSIDDGLTVSQKMWNNTFEGITGPVAIDALGDRIADFDIFHMQDPSTRIFTMIGRYRGATHIYSRVPGVEIQWPYGKPPDVPRCGFRNDKCIIQEPPDVILPVSLSFVGFLVISTIVGYIAYRKIRLDAELEKKAFIVKHSELQLKKGDRALHGSFLSKSRLSILTDHSSKGDDTEFQQLFTQVGFCRGNLVAVRKLKMKSLEQSRDILRESRELYHLQHPNIARFIGIVIEPSNNKILMEYCPRGSLQDIIENDDIDLDWSFRYSIIWDILKGLQYLHSSPIRYHGRLSGTNCVIDSRFMLKLTDFGIPSIYDVERREQLQDKCSFNMNKLLWTAPELLRKLFNSNQTKDINYQKADIYSFGITLQEIIVRGAPFEGSDLTSTEIIEKVREAPGTMGPFRPEVSQMECNSELRMLLHQCWLECPDERPNLSEVFFSFKKMNVNQKGNIMDNLMRRMEQYANNLESIVTERTKAYIEEKRKAEDLLCRLLPPSVAKQLETGNSVAPETFETVTIYFSDIVGFTTLASSSTPLEVVALLNSLYTCFDTIIHHFDVYKVETIGDAYMVVSGLPVRNGQRHVMEIANMSLSLLKAVQEFKIKHKPEEKLMIRIGINSGPVVAGVVGIAMPRYCLFGDTVNTASRMESTSLAGKIQISDSSKQLLDQFGMYDVSCRGEIPIKGKGMMVTYWLEGAQLESSKS
ncbi:atrial natriuretic peptide receptor 1-like [Crassostrea virginica]